MEERWLVVDQGHFDDDRFGDNVGLRTLGLESCVAVATFAKDLSLEAFNRLTLAHLTNAYLNRPELMERYAAWLTEQDRGRAHQAVAAVVGGWPGRSERLLAETYAVLERADIPVMLVHTSDGQHYHDLSLWKNGLLTYSEHDRPFDDANLISLPCTEDLAARWKARYAVPRLLTRQKDL